MSWSKDGLKEDIGEYENRIGYQGRVQFSQKLIYWKEKTLLKFLIPPILIEHTFCFMEGELMSNRGTHQFENNRDRGQKKWTSIMPTELITELRKWQQEDSKVKCPELDEFDMQNLQEEVERALISGMETRITTWSDGILSYHRGKIHNVNTEYLHFNDPFGSHRITINEIVAVMITE